MDWVHSLSLPLRDAIAGQYCQSRRTLPIGTPDQAAGDAQRRIHVALQQELPRDAVYSAPG
jgi:hypothetical protein